MNLKAFLCFLTAAGCLSYAQTCRTDNVRGSYGYLATFGVTGIPNGTSGGSPTFSSTPIGNLLKGIAGHDADSLGSTLYFDGAGNIFGANSQNSFIAFGSESPLGTYTVSNDCTLRVDLTDIFTAPPANGTPRTPASLVGLIARSGNEIYLMQTNEPETPPATGSALLNQRAVIRLVRFSSGYGLGCSASTLNGSYALIGSGYSSNSITGTPGNPTNPNPTNPNPTNPNPTNPNPTATVTPYAANFLAVVQFDGQGNLAEPLSGTSSLLNTFHYTGTYTVNADCTGTLRLSQEADDDDDDDNDNGEDAPAVTTIRFLITSPQGYVDNRGTLVGQNVQDVKPGLVFTIADGNQTISGTGVAQ